MKIKLTINDQSIEELDATLRDRFLELVAGRISAQYPNAVVQVEIAPEFSMCYVTPEGQLAPQIIEFALRQPSLAMGDL